MILDLIRINEVVEIYEVSSRTLRYYEEMGLLWSSRPNNKTQRYYDDAALERLKQIIVLRKLQIPIKDIAMIFKSESTTTLIQAFVDKLESLDTEITVLSELRRLVDDTFMLLREWVNNNDNFDRDTQRSEMLEEILPWDIVKQLSKYQQDVFIPIQAKLK